MADKYLKTGTGATDVEEVEAITTSAGAGDSGKVAGLDASGRFDSTMMPTGFGSDTKSLVASEALAAGDLVNVWDDAGVEKVRKADATTSGKEANGFVLAAVTLGSSATVYFDGTVTGLTGLTRGATYYLSASPGAVTTTRPSVSGNVVQAVGVAVTATELSFEPGSTILRA